MGLIRIYASNPATHFMARQRQDLLLWFPSKKSSHRKTSSVFINFRPGATIFHTKEDLNQVGEKPISPTSPTREPQMDRSFLNTARWVPGSPVFSARTPLYSR